MEVPIQRRQHVRKCRVIDHAIAKVEVDPRRGSRGSKRAKNRGAFSPGADRKFDPPALKRREKRDGPKGRFGHARPRLGIVND